MKQAKSCKIGLPEISLCLVKSKTGMLAVLLGEVFLLISLA